MSNRIRIKRPTWEDAVATAPPYPFITVKSLAGTDLEVLSNPEGEQRVDVLEVLGIIKYIAEINLPLMTSIVIKGLNAQGTDQIDTTLHPDYVAYSELCLYVTISSNRYCFGLINDHQSCF